MGQPVTLVACLSIALLLLGTIRSIESPRTGTSASSRPFRRRVAAQLGFAHHAADGQRYC